VSERKPVINQGPHQIQNQASIVEVWVLVLGFFTFFQLCPRVLLSITPYRQNERPGRKVWEYLVPSAVLDLTIGRFMDNLPPLASVFNISQHMITSQPGPWTSLCYPANMLFIFLFFFDQK